MPAYVVAESTVIDESVEDSYRQLAAASIAQYGGRYLVRPQHPETVEGSWPASQRIVIVEFQSLDQARQWYQSPEYTKAREISKVALRRTILFVDGATT